jgi:hypothetical protein
MFLGIDNYFPRNHRTGAGISIGLPGITAPGVVLLQQIVNLRGLLPRSCSLRPGRGPGGPHPATRTVLLKNELHPVPRGLPPHFLNVSEVVSWNHEVPLNMRNYLRRSE